MTKEQKRLSEPNLLLKRRLSIPIYGSVVLLYISRNPSKTHKRLKSTGAIEGGMEGNQGGTYSDGKNGFYILFELGEITKSAIAHEASHCAEWILQHVGHGGCRHCSNEPFAYLLGYIQTWIELQVNLAGIPIILDWERSNSLRKR
jgi:hypothetical protein